jgi:hypothetical protein
MLSYSLEKEFMVLAQFERLKKDSDELNIYAQKLKERGQIELAKKISLKRNYVLESLERLQPQNSP